MRTKLVDHLTWAAVATAMISAASALVAMPPIGSGWNTGRLLTAAMGGVLALLLLAVREALGAIARLQDRMTETQSALPAMRAQLDFLCHRVEAVRLGQSVSVGDGVALTLLAPAHPFYVDTRCRHIAPHLMTTGLWEPQYTRLFQRLIRPGDTVLDLGANHGVYAILAAAATGPTGRVHAFEPNPRLATLLRRSVEANGFTGHVAVHGSAVGDSIGTVDLSFTDQGSGGGVIRATDAPPVPDQERLRVPIVALDTVFPAAEFVVHAIKMDIEGFEGRAVAGMRRLLERSREVRILMEFAPAMLRAAGSEPAGLFADLSSLGFRFWTVRDDGGLDPIMPDALGASTVPVQNILVARQEPT